MARREFPVRVKRAAKARANGQCEAVAPGGFRCPCELIAGRFVYDHRVPDALGGAPTLENCQVICAACDRAKYPNDRARIDKARRQQDAHDGIAATPRRHLQSRGFPRVPPRCAASAPLDRAPVPRRLLFVPRSEP